MYKNKRRAQNNKCENMNKGAKRQANGKNVPQVDFAKISKRKRNNKENTSSSCDKTVSKRVTVPLDFFSQGMKSKTVRKNAKDCTFKKQNCHLLNEDLHALLRTVSVSSTELEQSPQYVKTKQSPNAQTHFDCITDYYVKLEAQQDVFPQKNKEQGTNENGGGGNKSIFKEINCLFQQAITKQDVQENIKKSTSAFNYSVINPQLKTNKLEANHECFNKKLQEQLRLVTLSDRTAQCMKKITMLVAEINTVLASSSLEVETKAPTKSKNKMEGNLQTTIPQLIPKSNWLYKTPHRQKLRQPILTGCTTELKPCILQARVDSNVVFELDGTTVTNLDFFDKKKFDISYNTSVCDVDSSMFNRSLNFNENLKIPPAIMDQMESRGVTSLFSNNTIPIFEDIQNNFMHKNRDVLVPRRPSKTSGNIVRDNIGTTRCLFFGNVATPQKFLPGNRQEKEAIRSKTNEMPAVVASKEYFRSLPQRDCSSSNKENCRILGLSNHPKRDFSPNETFVIDENLLLPTPPDLGDPLPLPFYPRNMFGNE